MTQSQLTVIAVPDFDHELRETGPLSVVVGPAAGHERVESRGAVVRFGQPDALLQLVDHVFVLQPEKRLLPLAHDLPHAHGCNVETTQSEHTSVRVMMSV